MEVETNFDVDTLRFPDVERRRIAESLFRPERTEDQLMKDDVLRNMLEIVDVVFGITAEETADRENISLEDAQEGMWALFEAGFIRLVSHSDSMSIELCLSRNERRAAAKKNKLLANYRRCIGEGALDRGEKHPTWVWAGYSDRAVGVAFEAGAMRPSDLRCRANRRGRQTEAASAAHDIPNL
jgi:hypothetical protein